MKNISKKELDNLPLVALVGRINVGKSTLFNLLVGERKALTAPVPGTTRDINYGYCYWRGQELIVADTGGFVEKPDTEIDKMIYKQAFGIIKKADVLLFIVDIKVGLNPDDIVYLKLIRKITNKKIILVANKADKASEIDMIYEKEWLKLGLGEPLPVSAVSGLSSGDLLDKILKHIVFKEAPVINEKDSPIRVSLVGRPNVGKSSILNAILGEERVIVSAQPHTTREPQDTLLSYQGKTILLVDTVGIRKKSKVKSKIEREGVIRSVKNIKKSDIVFLVLESNVTPSKQELRLASIANEVGANIVILVNKWDLVEEKQPQSITAFEKYFKKYFSFIDWAPIMFISAKDNQRISKILDLIIGINEERGKTIGQEKLDIFLKKAIVKQPPSRLLNKKKPVIYGFTQTKSCPPAFALIVNSRYSIDYAYLRYLENRMREQYGFEGTPISIYTEEKPKKVKK